MTLAVPLANTVQWLLREMTAAWSGRAIYVLKVWAANTRICQCNMFVPYERGVASAGAGKVFRRFVIATRPRGLPIFALKMEYVALVILALLCLDPANAKADCTPHAIDASVTVHMYDGSVSEMRPQDMEKASLDLSFQAFVWDALGRMPRVLRDLGLCDGSAPMPVMQAQFVYVPLLAGGFIPLLPTSEVTAAARCRIASPWLEFAYDPRSAPPVQARINWNERQILFDQATLDGQLLTPTPREPISEKEFKLFAKVYSTVMIGRRATSQDERLLASLLPSDLLWLFRSSWQSTLVPFRVGAQETLSVVLSAAAQRQASLSAELPKVCLKDDQSKLSYNLITQVPSDLVSPDYKIERIR